eukprot:5422489-Amphidinium_carterae.1
MAQYLTAVLGKVMPSSTDAEIAMIVQTRMGHDSTSAPSSSGVPAGDASDMCAPFADVLDDEDAEVLKAAIESRLA